MAEVPVPGATPQQTAAAVAFADVEGMVLGEQDSAAVKGASGSHEITIKVEVNTPIVKAGFEYRYSNDKKSNENSSRNNNSPANNSNNSNINKSRNIETKARVGKGHVIK
ncbi:MAG: hypothetical protein N2Z76_06635 [Treponemataceae bacterium]|nr:hypothetical protein [Treponemataceae bacterium]